MNTPADDVEYCNLPQALLWIAEGREPIHDDEFVALFPPGLPAHSAPYDRLILALRRGEIHARGVLVHMVEELLSEGELTPSHCLVASNGFGLEASSSDDVHYACVWLKSRLVLERLVRRLDDQVTPARNAWTSQNINWPESYLDLGRFVEPDLPDQLGLKESARQWQRLTLIQVSVTDLKATFPRAQACPAALTGEAGH
jgi:hypothetical protein